MNIYIYSSCTSMFFVYHPYFCLHFDWWLRFCHVSIGSVVCKFQFEKHDFPFIHASRSEWVLLHDIEQEGQKQTGEFLLRPQASKANNRVNFSINLLKSYMLRFHLTTKRYPLSTNVLYFHIWLELVEGRFVSNTCG